MQFSERGQVLPRAFLSLPCPSPPFCSPPPAPVIFRGFYLAFAFPTKEFIYFFYYVRICNQIAGVDRNHNKCNSIISNINFLVLSIKNYCLEKNKIKLVEINLQGSQHIFSTKTFHDNELQEK